MKVARIDTRNVVSAARSSTLQEAALVMRDRHVGSLLVTEDEPGGDHAIGIVTDRDMAVPAVAEGFDPQATTLADIIRSERDREAVQFEPGAPPALL